MRMRNALFLFAAILLLNVSSFTSDLALVHAKVYPSPTSPPIADGTILIHDGLIAAVGPTATIKAPASAIVLDCQGFVVTAGFWNSHVHIFTPATSCRQTFVQRS